MGFFVSYTRGKKTVQDNNKETEGQGVREQQLGAQCPVEESEIAGMPEMRIDSMFDQDVVGLFHILDNVGEVFTCSFHCQGAYALGGQNHQQPGQSEVERDWV